MQAIQLTKGQLIRLDTNQRYSFQFNPESIEDTDTVDYAVTKPIQSEQPLYEHISSGERTLKFQLFINAMEHFKGEAPVIDDPITKFFEGIGITNPRIQSLARQGLDGGIAVGAKLLPFAEGASVLANNPITGNIYEKFIGAKLRPIAQPVTTRPAINDIEFLRELKHGDGKKAPPELQFIWPGYTNSRWILTDLAINTNFWTNKLFPLHVRVDITLKQTFRGMNTIREGNAVVV